MLVLLVLAARLSAPVFGLLAVLLGVAKIAYLLAEIRIHEFLAPKLARYATRHPGAAANWTRLAVRLELGCNGVGILLCVAAAFLGQALGMLDAPWLLVACGAYLGANTFLKFSSLAILRCVGRIDVAAWHAIAGALMKLGTLAGALYLAVEPAVLMLCMTVPSLVIAVSLVFGAHRALRALLGQPRVSATASTRLRSHNLRRQLALLGANYATGFAEIGHRELDVQILAAVAGTTAAGGYRLAKTLAMVMLEALSPVVLMLLPEFSRRLACQDRTGLAGFVRRISAILGALGLVSAMAVLAASSLYLSWFAPSQQEAWKVVAVLVTGLAVMAPAMWAQSFLVASGRPQAYFRASLAGAVTAAMTTWLATGPWGAGGAAIGHISGLWVANGLAMRAAWSMMPAAADVRRIT
jgi:O-antigen/teichoic acid export membrane protein